MVCLQLNGTNQPAEVLCAANQHVLAIRETGSASDLPLEKPNYAVAGGLSACTMFLLSADIKFNGGKKGTGAC